MQPKLQRELLAHRGETLQQVTAAVSILEADQVKADQQLERLDLHQCFHINHGHTRLVQLLALEHGAFPGLLLYPFPAENETAATASRRGHQQHRNRKTGRKQQPEKARRGEEDPVTRKDLPAEVGAELLAGGASCHQERRRDRDHQGGNLAHQPVANGQPPEDLEGAGGAHAVIDHTDPEPAEDVHQHDDDSGHRVSTNELTGAVHRTVEISLATDLLPALTGRFLVDETGGKISIDAHLFPGHGIELEAGRHLRNPRRSPGNDNKLDQHDDCKNYETDHQVVTADKAAEGLNHLARRQRTLGGIAENQAGGRDIQRQAGKRHHQQQRWKDAEIQGARDGGGPHQDQQ